MSRGTTKKSTGTTIAIRTMDVLLWGAVAVCVAGVWMALTGIPLTLWWSGREVWVSPTALPQISQFDYAVTEEGPARAEVTLLPLWLRAIGVSSTVLFTAMLVMVLRSARLIAVRVMNSDPFAAEIPRSLRTTMIVVLCLAVVRFLVDLVTASALMRWQPEAEQFHSLGISTNLPSVSLSLVLAAIIAGVLATAFERGARLEQETDGLV